MNTIDLNTCKPGQKLRTREGATATYLGLTKDLSPEWDAFVFPHRAKSRGRTTGYTSDGRFYCASGVEYEEDIVEILPLVDGPAEAPRPVTTPLVKPKTPQELYLEGQKLANFQPGERVKVLFKVPNNAGGWDNRWAGRRDEFVGKVGVVHPYERLAAGIAVYVEALGEWSLFPWFCLERVAPEPVRVKLNGTWTAEVVSKDEVKVGCQTFKVQDLRTTLTSLDGLPAKGSRLNSSYSCEWTYAAPVAVTVQGREIPVENLRKLLAAVDAFPA